MTNPFSTPKAPTIAPLPSITPSPSDTKLITSPTIPESGPTSVRFKSNVTIEFQTHGDTPIRDRFASLFSSLKVSDPTLQLLPFKSTKTPISNVADIPAALDNFTDFLTESERPLPKGIKFYAYFDTASRIHTLKQNPALMRHLSQHRIWLRYHTISSKNITSVGWLPNKNPEAHSRNDLHAKMVQLLGGRFTTFQLHSRNVTFPGGKIKTRAWVVEMDRDDAQQWFQTFILVFKLENGPDSIQMVPFSAAAYASDDSIKAIFLLQNKYLHDHTTIRIDNLRGLDESLFLTNGSPTKTLRESFLSTTISASGHHVFKSVTQYNSGRVTLLVPTSLLDEAHQIIDNFIDEYVVSTLNASSIAKVTFPSKPPLRVGRPKMPEHIAVVASAIKNLASNINLDDASVLTTYSAPPPSRYARSYASVTAATAVSTPPPTSTRTEASDLTAEKTSRLDQLLAELGQRTNKLEADSQSIRTDMTKMQEALTTTVTELNSITKVLSEHSTTLTSLVTSLDQLRELFQNKHSSPRRKSIRRDSINSDTMLYDTHDSPPLTSSFFTPSSPLPPLSATVPPPHEPPRLE